MVPDHRILYKIIFLEVRDTGGTHRDGVERNLKIVDPTQVGVSYYRYQLMERNHGPFSECRDGIRSLVSLLLEESPRIRTTMN